MNSGSDFLQRLLRKLYATEPVSAAYLGGDLAGPSPHTIERIDLHLAVPPGFPEAMASWLAPLGELAFSGPDREGWRLVTTDGVEWLVRFYGPDAAISQAGLQPIFDRRPVPPEHPASPSASIDLALMAGRFWSDLYRVAGALARGWPLTAHGHLEECRKALVDLYRLALAPGQGGEGWEGAEAVPGVNQRLEPAREWLVAPLEQRAQLRSAHRLAAAYESLMLPLCQRLGVEYPMVMRNLAFKRLDQAAAGSAPAAGVPVPAAPSEEESQPEPPRPGRMRLAKGKIARPD